MKLEYLQGFDNENSGEELGIPSSLFAKINQALMAKANNPNIEDKDLIKIVNPTQQPQLQLEAKETTQAEKQEEVALTRAVTPPTPPVSVNTQTETKKESLENPKEDSFWKKNKTILIVGGSLVLVGVIAYLLHNSSKVKEQVNGVLSGVDKTIRKRKNK